MNRRGFFAALLAPLVVPFARPDKYVWACYWDFKQLRWRTWPDLDETHVMKGWITTSPMERMKGRFGTSYNAIVNQIVDNITLSHP